MVTKHVLGATMTVNIDGLEIGREIQIRFSYSAGIPEQGPTYASGGEPAEAESVEIDAVLVAGVERTDGKILTELPEWMIAAFEADTDILDWLIDMAHHDLDARANEAAEMKMDEARGN
jgi:hypothetical protein